MQINGDLEEINLKIQKFKIDIKISYAVQIIQKWYRSLKRKLKILEIFNYQNICAKKL